MHRSGTSFCARYIHSFGVPAPGELLAGDPFNPDGYFENSAICRLQEWLLVQLGRWWPSSSGALELPLGWLEMPSGLAAVSSLRDILQSLLAEAKGPFLIKDPRACLLLPLWKQVTAELALPLRLILNVRHPEHVAVSLVRRDALRAGMSLDRAYRLWWHHYRTLLMSAGDHRPLVIDYRHWHDPRAASVQRQRLLRFLGREDSPAYSTVSLRAPSTVAAVEPAPNQTLEFYQRLTSLCLEQSADRWPALVEWITTQPPAQELESSACAFVTAQRIPSDFGGAHPWSPAALHLSSGCSNSAAQLLQHWIKGGFSRADLHALAQSNERLPVFSPEHLRDPVELLVMGGTPRDWWVHAWIDQFARGLPIRLLTPGDRYTPGAQHVVLLLRSVFHSPATADDLLHLGKVDLVLDPRVDQASIIRTLRIPVQLLRPCTTVPADLIDASSIGLPSPKALHDLGSELLLGSGKQFNTSQSSLDPRWGSFNHLPDFDRFTSLLDASEACLLARWLLSCQQQGLQLVRLNPTQAERDALAWKPFGLGQPVQLFSDPITASELCSELQWRHQGCLDPQRQVDTPAVALSECERLSFGSDSPCPLQAAVSVCISLFNYADRVIDALESVRHQTLLPIQLLVVDDHSTDEGYQLCRDWLELHHQRFERAALIRHPRNLGLAAARNTAFCAAITPWCFVLDADNRLEPQALHACLSVADASSSQVAVVHPLIMVEEHMAEGQTDPVRSSLGWGMPWLKAQFRHGNTIDAMALVRHCAWRAVGGYAAIPGGWEDFDFWCLLVEAGWQGVMCPRVLARYISHPSSMQHQQSRHQLRRLSRLLQVRHPWLDLELAQPQR